MVALYRDPQGDSIFDRADAATMSTIHSNNKVLNMNDDLVDKDKTIENLRRRITQLESALSQNKAPENWLFKYSSVNRVLLAWLLLLFLFQYIAIFFVLLFLNGAHTIGQQHRSMQKSYILGDYTTEI